MTHTRLLEIYKLLNSKNNVLVFIETDDINADASLIGDWFKVAVHEKINSREFVMKNRMFLCFREIKDKMPRMVTNNSGLFSVLAIRHNEMVDIRESLLEKVDQ